MKQPILFVDNWHFPALPGKGRKKKGKKKTSSVKERAKVDINYLSCTHHKHIISGLAWLRDFGQRGSTLFIACFDLSVLCLSCFVDRVSLLVVGLGGGSLVSFIDRHLIVVSCLTCLCGLLSVHIYCIWSSSSAFLL